MMLPQKSQDFIGQACTPVSKSSTLVMYRTSQRTLLGRLIPPFKESVRMLMMYRKCCSTLVMHRKCRFTMAGLRGRSCPPPQPPGGAPGEGGGRGGGPGPYNYFKSV
eukprot:jgi/Botrbrau1/22919/Bobra.0523s0001.1